MSYRLMRALILAPALVLSSLFGVACDGPDKGGASVQPANANVNQSAGGATQVSTESQQIEMDDDVFRPALLTVAAGTKVTWVNKGHKAHTVVSNEKLFDSGLVNIDGQFSHTFDAPGTYSYHCAPHAKMIGQIVVK